MTKGNFVLLVASKKMVLVFTNLFAGHLENIINVDWLFVTFVTNRVT